MLTPSYLQRTSAQRLCSREAREDAPTTCSSSLSQQLRHPQNFLLLPIGHDLCSFKEYSSLIAHGTSLWSNLLKDGVCFLRLPNHEAIPGVQLGAGLHLPMAGGSL